MIKISKSVILHIMNSLEHYIIILVISLAMLFTVVQYTNEEYSFMVFNALTNMTLLVSLILPCFALMTYKTLNYLNQNTNIILKLKNRYSFVNSTIFSVLLVSLILFLELFIITLIISNLTPHQNFIFTNNFGYGCADIIVMGIVLIKLYLTIFSILLLGILFYNYFKIKSFSILFLLLVMMSLFFLSNSITGNIFTDTFNPSFHLVGHYNYDNIYTLIVSGLIYFGLTYSVLFLLIKHKIKTEDIGI